jgi:hypothetical protein
MPPETDPSALVAEVLTAADADRDAVPRLLGLLDVGDRQVRLGAATALCVVAEEHPDAVPSLAGRLADRAGEDGLAAVLALEYLGARYPDIVDEELSERPETEYEVGKSNPTRESLNNRDVGRTSRAGAAGSPGPRRVYTDDEDEADPARDTGEDDDGNTMGGRPRAADAEWLSTVESLSRFDRLSVLAPRDRRRYSDTFRTLGVVDETEYAVGLRLLRSGQSEGAAFADALAEALREWRSVADIGNVLTLHDWGREPRPWAATEYTEQRLTDRGTFTPTEAAWHAERLADAVSTLHERGVVHGGIDAQSVAYYGNVIQETDRQPPLLDNVGLLSVYRHRFDPSQFLDPRYAAPEYYESRFGRIDHATDIYQLGAVCYRLFTGESPYSGAFESVRDAVVSGDAPTPSAVADVPGAVDDIVGKAMAPRKLARYETAQHLRQELRGLMEGRDGE